MKVIRRNKTKIIDVPVTTIIVSHILVNNISKQQQSQYITHSSNLLPVISSTIHTQTCVLLYKHFRTKKKHVIFT